MTQNSKTQNSTQNSKPLHDALEILREVCCSRRKRYETRRRERLGACYSERLSFDIGSMVTTTLGEGVLSVLKTGDRLLLALNVDADPCLTKQVDGRTHLGGYIPIYSDVCRCRYSEYDDFMLIRTPLYIHGPLNTVLEMSSHVFKSLYSSKEDETTFVHAYYNFYERLFVVAEYKGDGMLEVTDSTDYDYYLATLWLWFNAYDDETGDLNYPAYKVEEVEGVVWYSVYARNGRSVTSEGGSDSKIVDLGACCEGDPWSMFIILALIRRDEVAKIRYSVDGGRCEVAISAKFPPTIKLRCVG